MKKLFTKPTEEETNQMTEYYISKKLLIEFYKYLESEGKFPNQAGFSEFWAERFLNSDYHKNKPNGTTI